MGIPTAGIRIAAGVRWEVEKVPLENTSARRQQNDPSIRTEGFARVD